MGIIIGTSNTERPFGPFSNALVAIFKQINAWNGRDDGVVLLDDTETMYYIGFASSTCTMTVISLCLSEDSSPEN